LRAEVKTKDYYKKLSKMLAWALAATAVASLWAVTEASMELEKSNSATRECIQTAKDWAEHVEELQEKYFFLPKKP
jgi:hypothetical protein